MEAPSSVRGGRWEARVFLALALFSIVPFWAAKYIPTSDGPCHLYNAWILGEYHNQAEYPAFTRTYEIDHRPLPNWLSHGAFAVLMAVVPPLAAEKILVSAYVLSFLAGLWTLVGAVRPGSRWPAFLGFPFLFNSLFLFGFYNFSFSLAFLFFTLALWWRGRETATLSWAVKLNLLLWLGWFAHILAVVVSLFAIGVLWLSQLRRGTLRRYLLHLPLLLPQLILPLWFVAAERGGASTDPLPLGDLFGYFIRLGPLVTFNPWLAVAANLLVMLFLLLIGLTLLRQRRLAGPDEAGADPGEAGLWGFPFLSVLFVAIYFLAPDGMSGGSILKPRLALYPFLILIPWFSRRLPAAGRWTLIAVLALAALANASLQIERYRALSPEIERYVRGLDAVEPGSRVLPLTFDRTGPAGLVAIFSHAIDHAALAKGLIDWDNYEAASTLFPVRFRPQVRRPGIYEIESAPEEFPLGKYLDSIDYVYTWAMPESAPVARELGLYFRPVAVSGAGILYRLRPELRKGPTDS